ncbi:MAG: ATP-dependent 6-phosphofructokinase [Dehalococcoidales bacterium]|jgi:6-phosphofructokinase 1
MKRIAVQTSGGDTPGMNAILRAVVLTGLDLGWEVFGVRYGYQGLISDNLEPLGARDVSGIIQQGGTILGTSRCPDFENEDRQIKALRTLKQNSIEALVVIGGSGAQSGAQALFQKGFPTVGVAATINNNLHGSDITVGVDTALNIVLEAIDRLKITASSHQRVFIVEVMGRDCGYLALMAGIAGAAEAIVIPEIETDPETLASEIRAAYGRGKAHALVVVSEGAHHNAAALAGYFEKHRGRLGFELRVTVLGHVQRGGVPSGFDRLLGTRLGVTAVDCLAGGQYGVLVGQLEGKVAATPLAEVVGNRKPLDMNLLKLAQVMAQ